MANLDRNGGTTARYGNCVTCSDASGRCDICNTEVPEAAYNPGLASYAGQGTWNDPDMLEVGNGGMSDVEDRSQFSMWAMMAAPLIAGNDLRSMGFVTRATLTNPEVIAVDQDPRGVQGQPIGTDVEREVWVKPLAATSTFAVALLNRTAQAADITVAWSEIGLSSTRAAVRDLWAAQDLGIVATQFTTTVPSHGVALLKVVGQ